MAKVNIELKVKECKLEVGDIVITEILGARMIAKHHDMYYGVDLANGTIGAREDDLSALERLYCSSSRKFRIIKSDDIVVSEVGGTA